MITTKSALTAVATLVFALGASAGQAGSRNDGSRTIDLHESAVVAGAKVPPGSYTLRWVREPGSEEVQIELTHGRKILAEGKGVWTESTQPSPYEALVYHSERGTNELTEIRFRRSNEVIRLDADATSAEAHRATGPGTK